MMAAMPLKDRSDVIGGRPKAPEAPEPARLRREVEPPAHQPGGLGILLCASAAMFFAVAGSAFVVRAQLRPHCCDHHHVPTHPAALRAAPEPGDRAARNDQPHITNTPAGSFSTSLLAHRRSPAVNPDVAPPAFRAAPADQPPCGAPSYHTQADGTVTISYRLCPSAADSIAAP